MAIDANEITKKRKPRESFLNAVATGATKDKQKPTASARGELKKTSTRFYADTVFDVSDKVTELRRKGHKVAGWQIFQAAIDLVLSDEAAFNRAMKPYLQDEDTVKLFDGDKKRPLA
jgi:hypothetical protein